MQYALAAKRASCSWGCGMELCHRRVRLGIRNKFYTRGWWA